MNDLDKRRGPAVDEGGGDGLARGPAFEAGCVTADELRHVRFAGQVRPPRQAAQSGGHACKGRGVLGQADESRHDDFIQWLMSQAGLRVAAYRPQPLLRRLPACMRALKARSLPEAMAAVACQPEKLRTALNALLIGVTAMYRDPAVFDAVQSLVLPRLAGRQEDITVWSAGCSNGAELYTMAMLLAEAGLLGQARLLGTDCRPEALADAARGVFPLDHIRTLPARLSQRYLRPREGKYAVDLPGLRRIEWRCSDLLAQVEPGPWDVILCRNVTIYMSPEASGRLWAAMTGCLKPGGFLIVGKAERPAEATLIKMRRGIYRKQEDRE